MVFAEFARYSLRSVPDTTLAEELENVDRYLTLQRSRFRERLQVQLDVVRRRCCPWCCRSWRCSSWSTTRFATASSASSSAAPSRSPLTPRVRTA